MNKKKTIIDIIIVIVCAAIILGVIFYIRYQKKEHIDEQVTQTCHFKFVYKDNQVIIDEDLEFKKGQKLYSVLNEHYTLETRIDAGLKAITGINGYTTDFTHDYLSLMINGNYSTQGVEFITLEQDMNVEIIWLSTGLV